MDDKTTTIEQLKEIVFNFINEREWQQFHSPKNVSMGIAVEAAELMEKFIWCDSKDAMREFEADRKEISYELADVLISVINFANVCNIDLAQIVKEKLAIQKEKYPIDKAKGRYTKYTHLK